VWCWAVTKTCTELAVLPIGKKATRTQLICRYTSLKGNGEMVRRGAGRWAQGGGRRAASLLHTGPFLHTSCCCKDTWVQAQFDRLYTTYCCCLPPQSSHAAVRCSPAPCPPAQHTPQQWWRLRHLAVLTTAAVRFWRETRVVEAADKGISMSQQKRRVAAKIGIQSIFAGCIDTTNLEH